MFCPKCGKTVKDGYEFCMGCGTKIELADENVTDINGSVEINNDIPKSRKKIFLFGTISIVVIALVVAGILFVPKFFSAQIPYAAMNVNNGAQLACDGNTVVYIGKFDSSDKKAVLLKSNSDGTGKNILLDDEEISSVYLYDKKVYYHKHTDDKYIIYSVGLDGKDNKELISVAYKDNTLSNLVVADGHIYYLLNKKVHQTNLDGSNDKEIISADVNDFCIDSRTMFFSSDGYIKKKKSSSDSIDELSKIEARSLCVYNGDLYFHKSSGGMYKLNLKTNSVESLGGNDVRNYIVDSDKIYYVESLSTDEISTYASLFSDSETDELWVKIALIGTGKLYSMDFDGKNRKEVDTETLLMSSIYNTPQNKFTKVSFLSDGLEILELK